MNKLGLAVAIVALILGAVGVYYGMQITKVEQALRTDMDTLRSDMATKAEVSKLDGDVKRIATDANRVLSGVGTRLDDLERGMFDLTNRVAKVSGPAAGGAEGGGKKAAGGKMAKPANGVYTAKSGDTLAKIARQFGVSKNAITDKNPDLEIDKIGQGTKIKIP